MSVYFINGVYVIGKTATDEAKKLVAEGMIIVQESDNLVILDDGGRNCSPRLPVLDGCVCVYVSIPENDQDTLYLGVSAYGGCLEGNVSINGIGDNDDGQPC